MLLCSCSEAPEPQPPDPLPARVDQVVADIVPRLALFSRAFIYFSTRDDFVVGQHSGMGRGIRNHYGLWRGNEALILDACKKPCVAEDASWVIIGAIWNEVHRKGMVYVLFGA
jgi:hypothetical protein